MTNIVYLLFLALLAAPFVKAQASARIFVYAQRETTLRSWQPISCDGILVARIKRGTFFAIDVTPGRHVLSQKNGVPAFVDVKAGDELFLRTGSQIEVGHPAVLVFNKVHPDVARKEMRFVLYIDAKEVVSTSVPRADPREPSTPHLKTRNKEQ